MGNLDRIRKALEKAEFERVEDLITRAKQKEPMNPGIDYYSSLLFSTEAYSGYNLDSARIYVNVAIENFDKIDTEKREDLEENEVTIEKMMDHRDMIRDKVYQKLLSGLTITLEKIAGYREKYPQSPYDSSLIYKNDSIVFQRVKEADTKEAYQRFLSDYHTASFKEESCYSIG